jgi:hypothetical protein
MVIARGVTDAGLDLPTAVELGTLQPGRLVPTADDPWTCKVGAPANLVELEWDGKAIEVRKAVVRGYAVEN